LRFNHNNTAFGVGGNSKKLEIYKVHSSEKIEQKKEKRVRKSQKKGKKKEDVQDIPSDEYSPAQVFATGTKIVSFAFSPIKQNQVYSTHIPILMILRSWFRLRIIELNFWERWMNWMMEKRLHYALLINLAIEWALNLLDLAAMILS